MKLYHAAYQITMSMLLPCRLERNLPPAKKSLVCFCLISPSNFKSNYYARLYGKYLHTLYVYHLVCIPTGSYENHIC